MTRNCSQFCFGIDGRLVCIFPSRRKFAILSLGFVQIIQHLGGKQEEWGFEEAHDDCVNLTTMFDEEFWCQVRR